jgi:hypothetical protein
LRPTHLRRNGADRRWNTMAARVQFFEQFAAIGASEVREFRCEFSKAPRAVDPAANEETAGRRHGVRCDKLVQQPGEFACRLFAGRRAVGHNVPVGCQKQSVQSWYAGRGPRNTHHFARRLNQGDALDEVELLDRPHVIERHGASRWRRAYDFD